MTDYFMGIDIGAATTKAVLIDREAKMVLARSVIPSGVDFAKAAQQVRDNVLNKTSTAFEDVKFIISTGYGRGNVEFANDVKTEINCHARGVFFYFPESALIVDIGGQDNKIIKIDSDGKRLNFKMNRKCAAGTGTFLEEIANRLGVPLENMDTLARKASKDITLNSFCTVFASTEILARIREGETVENMVKGAFHSIVNRVIELGLAGAIDQTVVFTGGVVQHNPYLVELIKDKLQIQVKIPPEPQVIGALGAALLAQEKYMG
jgi:predicted CoA-substrate-specific enzyme activase